MPRRHALPRIWLFTDERQGDALWDAIRALPKGRAGVIFRHYRSPDRKALAARVRALCKRQRLLFVFAGSPRQARAARADGAHGRRPGSLTAPAHNRADLIAARRNGALPFLSPVFATRSHSGARALGTLRFGLLADGFAVAALGGMTERRFDRLTKVGATAWGAIDAFLP